MRLHSSDKAIATLQARAALQGVRLDCIDSDYGRPVFIASRLAMTRQLDSVDRANAWLQSVTGKDAEAGAH